MDQALNTLRAILVDPANDALHTVTIPYESISSLRNAITAKLEGSNFEVIDQLYRHHRNGKMIRHTVLGDPNALTQGNPTEGMTQLNGRYLFGKLLVTVDMTSDCNYRDSELRKMIRFEHDREIILRQAYWQLPPNTIGNFLRRIEHRPLAV